MSESTGPEHPPRPRAAVQRLPDRPHGGPVWSELARLGLRAEDVADFSVNVNPLGASPRVRAAVAAAPIDRYPDPEATKLRAALARHLDVAPDWLLAVSGTAEAIWGIAAAYLDPGDRVLVVAPAFGEYAAACAAVGACVEACPADPRQGLVPDPDSLAEAVRRRRPRLTFLCNPNNPSGTYLPAEAVGAVAAACAAVGGLLVLDEAYVGFVARPWPALPLTHSGHVIVLRSLTKDLGLAGLRLGYVVGHPAHIAALRRARPPWTVNACALAAGLAALGDADHAERSRRAVGEAMAALRAGLAARGLPALPSAVNFLLARVGDGARLRASLLRRGVLVRDCASFGLPEYVRLAARPPAEIERLFAALDAARAAGELSP